MYISSHRHRIYIINYTTVATNFSKHKLTRMFNQGYKLAFEAASRKKKWKEIFALWSCAAAGGLKRAQFYAGTCHDNGLGTPKNIEEAYKWFYKAAKQGHRDSQYNIGCFFREGEVVKQNDKKGVYWYTLAAHQGHFDAQRNLV